MENELMVKKERQPLTAAEILAQVRLIQEVMNAVMKEGHHYGKIPGTPKPTLYKPGAEKLLSTFHIGADPTECITDLSTEDETHYRMAVRGFSQATGNLLGIGIGECSSNEEKYKWRKPICDEEFDETPTDRKRVAWKKAEGKPYQQKQVRMNPSDIANTILKMAKKRALVDMTLTVTAASDIFDQDIEDLPEGMELRTNGKPAIKEPQKKKEEDKSKSDHLSVVTQILNVLQKDGMKSDKKTPYTLYTIIGQIDGKDTSFKTFSKTMADEGLKAKGTPALFEIHYRPGAYGYDIVENGLVAIGPEDDTQS